MSIRIFLSFLITPLLYAIVLSTLSAQPTAIPEKIGGPSDHLERRARRGDALLILDSNACVLDQFGDATKQMIINFYKK